MIVILSDAKNHYNRNENNMANFDDEILDDIPDMPEEYDIPDMPEDYDMSPDEMPEDVSDELPRKKTEKNSEKKSGKNSEKKSRKGLIKNSRNKSSDISKKSSSVSEKQSGRRESSVDYDDLLKDLPEEDDEYGNEYTKESSVQDSDYSEDSEYSEYTNEYSDEYSGENYGEEYSSEDNMKTASGRRISRKRYSDETEADTDTRQYYGIEEERPRTPKKIVPKEQEKTRSLRLKRYKDQNLARFSNIYMLAGMLIGVAVFYFLVSPEIKDDYKEKLRALETSYNQTISTKNNEIENLKLERDSLNSKNTEYENSAAQMQATIDNLTSEVEMLKKTVENSGLSLNVPDTATTTDAVTTSVIQRNEAAERNNANIIGISGYAVEDIISNE